MREGGEQPDRPARRHEAQQPGPEHDVVQHGRDAGRVAKLQLGEAQAHGEPRDLTRAGDRGDDDLQHEPDGCPVGDLRGAGADRGDRVARKGRQVRQPERQRHRIRRGEDGFDDARDQRGAVDRRCQEQAGDAQKRPQEMAEPEQHQRLVQDHGWPMR
jgi:hypothetical protein